MQSDDVPSPVVATNDPAPLTAAEYGQGLNLPTNVYPLFENARRARLGWTMDEHRDHLGRLWSNFATVAATNPYAWIQRRAVARGDHHTERPQSNGLVPVHQVVDGEHAGRHGGELTS